MAEQKTFFFISLFFLAIIIFSSYPGLIDRHVIEYDSAMLPYFANPNRENPMLNDDLQGEFFADTGVLSFFMSSYSQVMRFIQLELMAKIIPLVLMYLSFIYAFRVGLFLKDKKFAIYFSALFAMYSTSFHFFNGGGVRSYGIPLAIIFTYYFLKKSHVKAGIVAIISSLIYPPLTLVFMLALAIRAISIKPKIRISKQITAIVIVSSLIILALNISYIGQMESKEYLSYEEMKGMKEFAAGADLPLFTASAGYILNYIFNKEGNLGFYSWPMMLETGVSVILTLALIAGSIFFLFISKRKSLIVPKDINLLAASAIFFYVISYASLRLFGLKFLLWPISYSKYIIPIWLLGFFALNLDKYIDSNAKKPYIKLLFPAIIIITTLFYVCSFDYDFESCDNPEMYSILENLDNSLIIAGHPKTMDCVPLLSNKRVFSNLRSAMPPGREYYLEIKNRNKEMINIFYTTSGEEFSDFCKDNNIDIFVIDHKLFMEENSAINEDIKEDKGIDFSSIDYNARHFLENPPAKRILFHIEEDDVSIIDCR